jgi:hypothetical protein
LGVGFTSAIPGVIHLAQLTEPARGLTL